MKKNVFLAFVLVLFSTASIVGFSEQWIDEGVIFIRADGRVEGTDKIQREGNVYTLTDDINGSIVVEKDNIVIDGAGYTLQGNGNGNGVNPGRDVTVQNLQIINFGYGISNLNNNTIFGNYIADCFAGIFMMGGSNITVKNNTFANNINAISVAYGGGNITIIENNMINDEVSTNNVIIVWMAPEPIVDRNYWSDYNGADNDGDGIGDTPYVFIDTDYARYMDEHPLMEPVPVIPEFPTWTSIILLFVVLTITIAICKRRLLKTPIH